MPVSIMLSDRFLPDELAVAYTDGEQEFSIEENIPLVVSGCVYEYGKHGHSRSILGTDLPIDAADLTEGLVGLMVLGDAWASIDAHETLALSLIADESRLVIAQLAALRGAELAANGSQSILFPDRDLDVPLWFGESIASFVSTAHQVDQYFDQTRPLVDEINADRTAFINARLADGKHPDTHPDFWDGYSQTDLPPLPGKHAIRNFRVKLIGVCLFIFWLAFLVARRDWRRGGRIGPSIGLHQELQAACDVPGHDTPVPATRPHHGARLVQQEVGVVRVALR